MKTLRKILDYILEAIGTVLIATIILIFIIIYSFIIVPLCVFSEFISEKKHERKTKQFYRSSYYSSLS